MPERFPPAARAAARRSPVWAIALAALLAGCPRQAPEPKPDFGAEARRRIESLGDRVELPLASPEAAPEIAALRRRFYEERGFAAAWTRPEGVAPAAAALVAALAAAPSHGLDPRLYARERLAALVSELSSQPIGDVPVPRLVDFDVAFTTSYLRYAADLAGGAVRAAAAKLGWAVHPLPEDLLPTVAAGVTSGDVAGALERLASHPDYEATRGALEHYRRLAESGGWPTLEAPPADAPPPEPWLARLRERLARSGDVAADAPSAPEAVAEGLRIFQTRHGLEATGLVDEPTLAALNVPAAERAAQLERALERLRWMPADLGARFVLVNVPAYQLVAVENGEKRLEMRVVAGKPEAPTPTLDSAIHRVVFNPQWNVPESIAEEEVLPKMRKNPEKAAREGLSVVRRGGRDHVVQKPGPKNPLGRVQFLFENPYAVYLHDTPAETLFTRDERGLSHGCVRVEQPLELAELVLQSDPRWNSQSIRQAIESGERQGVKVPDPLPIHLVYWTAWGDGSGAAQFRNDVYGLDPTLAGLLALPAAGA